MSEWGKYRLGDLATMNYGKSLTAEKRLNGDVPVYSSAGICGWHNEYLENSNAIIVGRKGNSGSVFYSKTPFYCIDTAYYILPDKSYNLKFLYYKLLSLNLIRLTSDSAVPGLNRETAYAQEITIPDLPTQTQIASILTSFDDKIELLGQMNQTLETMAQTIFKEWFVDFNFPGFDGELVDGLPKGWRKGKLGDEFDLVMGQSPKGETYNEDGKGMVFYQGRTDFGFRFPSNRLFTTEPNRKANYLDTLISVRAPVGDINMANEPCCIGRGLSSVRHKTKAFSYTYYLMKNIEDIFKSFESEGTVFGSINKSNFEDIEILIPELKILTAFETAINPIDYKILENSNQIRTLTQLRDTLLPKFMSGQVKINTDFSRYDVRNS